MHSTSNDVLLLLIDSSFNMYFTFYAKKTFQQFFFQCFKAFFSKKNISNGFTTDSRSKRVQVAVKDTKRTSPRFCIKKTEKLILMIFFFAAFLKRGSVRIISSLHFFHRIFVSLQLLKKSHCSDCLQRKIKFTLKKI